MINLDKFYEYSLLDSWGKADLDGKVDAKSQNFARYYELLLYARVRDVLKNGLKKVTPLDTLLATLDYLNVPLDSFLFALETIAPETNNEVDKLFCLLNSNMPAISNMPVEMKQKLMGELERYDSKIVNEFLEAKKEDLSEVGRALGNDEKLDRRYSYGFLFSLPLHFFNDVSKSAFIVNKMSQDGCELKPLSKKQQLLLQQVLTGFSEMEVDHDFNVEYLSKHMMKINLSLDNQDIVNSMYRDKLRELESTIGKEFKMARQIVDEKDNVVKGDKKERICSGEKSTTEVDTPQVVDLKSIQKSMLAKKENFKTIKSEIVGQDEAIDAIMQTMKSVACGLVEHERPLMTLLLNGPTGVGKTETAKALARNFFDNKLFTIDMSTFKSPASVTKLTGAAPGYIGYNESVGFIEFVKENPSGVVLFDEIDKCHPSCLTALLRILDEGKFKTARGDELDLTKYIVIATTNREANTSENNANKNLQELASMNNEEVGAFKSEFLGRFNKIFQYNKLTKDNLKDILAIKLQKIIDNAESFYKDDGLKIEYGDKLLDDILIDAQAQITGARALNGSIQDIFVGNLTNYLFDNSNLKNTTILMADKNTLIINGQAIKVNVEEKPLIEEEKKPSATRAEYSYFG